MSAELARVRLDQLLRRWKLARAGAFAFALGASALLWEALANWLPALAAGTIAMVMAAAAIVWAFHRTAADLPAIARHLDRIAPELEESAELLLAAPETLSALERLQRVRVAKRIAALGDLRLPRTFLRRAVAPALAIVALAGLALAAARALSQSGAVSVGRAALPPGRPVIGGAAIVVRPPAYTRLPPRASNWELDVEAGADVAWRVRANGAERIRLIRFPGDTVALHREGDEWTGQLVATASSIYQLVLDGAGGRTTGPIHRLTVRPDEPPSLVFVAPTARTLLDAGAPATVPILVLVADDYGVASSGLVATVTSGAGEQVKFRERRLPITSKEPRPGNAFALHATVDPAALGMGPGDEVYLYAVAWDTRRPQPNEGRSETVVIAIADTSDAALADFGGLSASVQPAHLRSQRQIILDTEHLLREQRNISTAQFRERAAAIGVDQQRLRSRYAEFLGGESVGDAAARSGPDSAIASGLEHEHDTEENATRLAPAAKATLTAAVAQMWEAEGRLRTFDARGALPSEYRALRLLKQAQQADRAYVRKSSPETPPLDLSRRLTGIGARAGATIETRAESARVALPAARAALVALTSLRAGRQADATSRSALEAALREVAGDAAAGSGPALQGLRALRSILDSLAAPAPCGGCVAAAEARLWALLPPAEPTPGTRAPASRLGQAYLDLMARER